jgi:hypothetical protein
MASASSLSKIIKAMLMREGDYISDAQKAKAKSLAAFSVSKHQCSGINAILISEAMKINIQPAMMQPAMK